MNKKNKKGAAGLRRSALVEHIRLREEWSALKETDVPALPRQQTRHVLEKENKNVNIQNAALELDKQWEGHEALRGVVALVEAGGGGRALALRAALAALGASVAPRWSPLVTHLVWAEGGCRATRARARALAVRLVSPLWVEACATAARRLPERAFPAATRPSDIPSPRTLQSLLRRAEEEGAPLSQLFPRPHHTSDSEESSDTTSGASDAEGRVNTKPRGGAASAPRSRRKLFTQREQGSASDEPSAEENPAPRLKAVAGGGRALARAERLARRLARIPNARATHDKQAPRLVLTGMTRTERHLVGEAVRALAGRLQNNVTRKTTHVLLGTCRRDCTENESDENTTLNKLDKDNTDISVLRKPNGVLTPSKIYDNLNTQQVPANVKESQLNAVTGTVASSNSCNKLRTLKALEGAARGCRVLRAQWALDSANAKRWIHHHQYQVPHLYTISQKARAERQALGRMRSDYAYDVFRSMRVRLGRDVEQRDACVRLLSLCGGIVIDHDGTLNQSHLHVRHGRAFQDGVCTRNGGEFDLTVGTAAGEVASKWVFDSVAASRMRTTRRYINHERASLEASQITLGNS